MQQSFDCIYDHRYHWQDQCMHLRVLVVVVVVEVVLDVRMMVVDKIVHMELQGFELVEVVVEFHRIL